MDEPIPRKPKSDRRRYLLIGLLAVIAVLLVILPNLPTSSSLINSGTVEHIKIGHYYYVKFNTTKNGKVTGDFSSDNNFSLYVLSASQFSFDSKFVTFVKNSYNQTDVKHPSFSFAVTPGTWYFVLVNPNSYQNVTITVNTLKLVN